MSRHNIEARGLAASCSVKPSSWPGPMVFHSIVARVSATQQASVALHEACGFDLIGVEREIGRKFGRWVDVALLQRLL